MRVMTVLFLLERRSAMPGSNPPCDERFREEPPPPRWAWLIVAALLLVLVFCFWGAFFFFPRIHQ